MNNLPYMKISEFAKITGIKRSNLIFYDNIGLLSPEFRGDNNYRFYTHRQLSVAYLISGLRSIGVSIEEIKQYADKRTPLKMTQLFDAKEKDIEKEIEKLREIQGIMKLYVDLVEETAQYDTETIFISEFQEREIYAGPTLDNKTGKHYAEASFNFYDFVENQNKSLNYPFGVSISQEYLLKNDFTTISNCYFLVPGFGNNARPAGCYVVGHMHGSYGEAYQLYDKLMKYIRKNNLVICGNAYEEYPYNEMTHEEEEEYLIRVMIQII